MYIPIILGTARKGRKSEYAANFMLGQAKSLGLESGIIDVKDYRIEATDNTGNIPEARKFEEIVGKADALAIVSPEYNHGYPGELKMMLDMLYGAFFHKVVGICGVSNGMNGGARMVQQLRQNTIALKMIPINNAVYFRNVNTLFDEKGTITDQSYAKMAKGFFNELVAYTAMCSKEKK